MSTPSRQKRLTLRVSPRFGERVTEIKSIVRGVMRDYMPMYDAGVLLTVLPSDEYLDDHWGRNLKGKRVVPTGRAWKNGWISMPHGTMPVSARYAIALWIPLEPDAIWPYFEFGSQHRWVGTHPPEVPPRIWPVHRHDDWREELVAVTGHEAKHVLDYSRGERPSRPEVEAERAAARAVEAWRMSR